MPKGNYIEGKNVYNITETIIKKTLDFTLGYDDLYMYFKYHIMSLTPKSNVEVYYSIYHVMKYIIKYISKIKGGSFMEQERIVSKGYHNGLEIAKKLDRKTK